MVSMQPREFMKYFPVLIGVVESTAVLLSYLLIYNFYLIDLVRSGQKMFWDNDFFFLVLVSIFPFFNLFSKRYKILMGNLIGFLIYLFVLIPIGILFSGGH